MGEENPQELMGVVFQQPRGNGSTFTLHAEWRGAYGGSRTQVFARLLYKLFQRKACRSGTTKLVCARFAPYFSITHPRRGTLAGPFFKLPSGHRRLLLDAVATMLYNQGVKNASSELCVVEKRLRGREEKEHWDQISRSL